MNFQIQSNIPQRYLFLIIGLLAGYILYLFTHLQDQVNYFLTTFTIIAVMSYLLISPFKSWQRFSISTFIITLIFSLGFFYSKYLLDFPYYGLVEVPGCLLYLGLYMMVCLQSVYCEENRFSFPYHKLFINSWNIGIFILISMFFTILAWAIIFLFGQLFSLIGIEIINKIIGKDYFIFPVTFGLIALGIAIAKEYIQITASIRKIFLVIFKLLFIPYVLVSLAFLCALPFATVKLSDYYGLFVSMAGGGIFFFNAVYQDGDFTKPPYNKILNFFVTVFLVILPILPLYALYFPISNMMHYGVSPNPLLQTIVFTLIFLYCLSYSISALFSKKSWMSLVKIANPILAIITVVTFIAMTSPFLDVFRLSACEQAYRVKNHLPVVNTDTPYLNPVFLARMNLSGLDLQKVDLRYAYFAHANLSNTNFQNAKLNFAVFYKADLSNADFSYADLSDANFYSADLTNAKFDNANLKYAYGLKQEMLDKACGANVKGLASDLKLKPCK